MKKTIEIIALGLLIISPGFMATADTLIMPTRPAGTGWRITELENYPIPTRDITPVKYKWIRIKKTTDEIRLERDVLEYRIRENRMIRANNRRIEMNRTRMRRAGYPYSQRGTQTKITLINPYKWIKVVCD